MVSKKYMIDYAAIQFITDVLNSPGAEIKDDGIAMEQITKLYPYFLPSRYISALKMHRNEPYSLSIRALLHGYYGNFVLLNSFLEATPTDEEIVYKPLKGDSASKIILEFLNQKEVLLTTKKKTLEIGQQSSTSIKEEYDPFITDFNNFKQENTKETIQEKPQQTVYIQEKEFANNNYEDAIIEEVYETKNIPEIQPEHNHIVEQTNVITNNFKEKAKAERIRSYDDDKEIIEPLYRTDYFQQQGIPNTNEIPKIIQEELPNNLNRNVDSTKNEEDKSLMVVMSFAEWLLFFKKKELATAEEIESKRAVRSLWQKEKLAAAFQEENDEIPENVFDMAVNSITMEDDMASESLANIYIKQEKYDKAIEMYRKLSLLYPEKNLYFARKIDEILKDR